VGGEKGGERRLNKKLEEEKRRTLRKPRKHEPQSTEDFRGHMAKGNKGEAAKKKTN